MSESLVLEFDTVAFSLAAIQKACLRFTNIASFEVQLQRRNDIDVIEVIANSLREKTKDGMDYLAKILRNEALDQQLREQIRAQTESVRNLVLAYAFSKTGLIAAENNMAIVKESI